MHEYDTTLKELLQNSPNSLLKLLTGKQITRWLNVELPRVNAPRVDLLGETDDGGLLQLELQSTNDRHLPIREVDYISAVYHSLERIPDQIVLYVGEAQMNMPTELAGPNFLCRYTLIDIRDLNSDQFLNSPHIADNVLGVLTRLQDQAAAARHILSRISHQSPADQGRSLTQLMILAGLRKLTHTANTIKEEAKKMPILNNILDHEVLGPLILQGRQEGLQEGLQEGIQKGIQKGALAVVKRLLEKKFRTLPEPVQKKLALLNESELQELSLRLFDVDTLDDLFTH